MAPTARRKADNSSSITKAYKSIKEHLKLYFSIPYLHALVFDPQKLPIVAVFLIVLEAVVNVLVIHNVPYTEIDWIAYMQEVGGFLNGTMDYRELKGDTGPLVYPAGFVFVYSALYHLTDEGKDVRFAQYIFAFIYITFLALVLRIYCKAKKIPPYALVLACCTSYRIHSIFILRLFNDTIAMWLLYASLNLFLDTRWNFASVLFSLAVSVKMNVLLYAPALLLAYLTSLGIWGTLKQLTICAAIQLFLGAPFLLTNPLGYLQGAFDLGRIFKHEWTVNYRFLPEEIFTDRYFHLGLLAVHLLLLAAFFASSKLRLSSWSRLNAIGVDIAKQLRERKQSIDMGSKAQLFLLPLFTANLIGVACSRSLHYQFYVWYFHTLPYLAWCCPWSPVVKLVILGVIESSWNVFPSTFLSSALLHVAHVALLYGLWVSRDARGRAVEVKRNA